MIAQFPVPVPVWTLATAMISLSSVTIPPLKVCSSFIHSFETILYSFRCIFCFVFNSFMTGASDSRQPLAIIGEAFDGSFQVLAALVVIVFTISAFAEDMPEPLASFYEALSSQHHEFDNALHEVIDRFGVEFIIKSAATLGEAYERFVDETGRKDVFLKYLGMQPATIDERRCTCDDLQQPVLFLDVAVENVTDAAQDPHGIVQYLIGARNLHFDMYSLPLCVTVRLVYEGDRPAVIDKNPVNMRNHISGLFAPCDDEDRVYQLSVVIVRSTAGTLIIYVKSGKGNLWNQLKWPGESSKGITAEVDIRGFQLKSGDEALLFYRSADETLCKLLL
jgi:hypothetical protein